jgi:hypothetical protein
MKLLTTFAILALSTSVAAQNWSDDFDRPDSDVMGPDWTEIYGDIDILNNQGYEGSGGNSKMAHNSATVPYTDAVVTVKFEPLNPGSGYVAIIIGDGGSRNLFTKIQDNDGDQRYETIFFYSKDNGTSWGGGSIQVSQPMRSGVMTCYVTANGDRMNVDFDTDFDGIVDQHYENDGILGFAGSLGTGLALGAWSNAAFDDWVGGTGETLTGAPASISMATGGAQALTLNAGAALAGNPYFLAGSVSGTSPGIPLLGETVPLNFDAYTNMTVTGGGGVLFPVSGVVGPTGQGNANFILPALPSLIGLQVNHAGLVLDLGTGTLLLVTNAASCDLVP